MLKFTVFLLNIPHNKGGIRRTYSKDEASKFACSVLGQCIDGMPVPLSS